ncbi:MAG: type II toxin-antitoxin system Phd/YefM family antitoxin [Planctomycetes bacterium]|nr:type II toxin-antitoxin system Phd/YefM family antitoxin [Planctomycetota bacterium]
MARIPEVITVSDLRQSAAAILRRVRGQKLPVVITQRGRASAVMLSLDAYERAENAREVLLLLARGEKEIAAGKGHDLESVLADADALLREETP